MRPQSKKVTKSFICFSDIFRGWGIIQDVQTLNSRYALGEKDEAMLHDSHKENVTDVI